MRWLLTTSSLITAISTVLSPITTVRRWDALSIAAPECSTAASAWNEVHRSERERIFCSLATYYKHM